MKRYIPLNASESAVLVDANTLLPRDSVYEPLTKMIIEAVNKVKNADGKPLNMLREHNAISIDGARGTGKTAVLVNLKSYLKDQDVLKDVHLFDPIDPTLLEEGESLFLHIIVAAVLHDKDVKEAQRKEPNKARNLNQTLEKLAQSLESIETQKNCHGMDKIRAMYSNKHLADCVQDFFREVLSLLGKKLLILPIDDVDTSLNRAFENLEIVRRYLATPYVLPIVSGDRELYNEVTWRDFHGRLTKDSKHLSEAAYETAVELAAEYQRKILPFPRRLTMPEVSQYWQEKDIYLRNSDKEQPEVMPLRNFIAWLEIFLTGPVNGVEGSRPPLPIPSIRALSQLISYCHDLIPKLPAEIRTANDELDVRRNWQMPPNLQNEAVKAERQKGSEFAQQLEKYFRYEPKAGAAYLILLAKLHWQEWLASSSSRHRSVLDTPLFQPLSHAAANFDLFDKENDLSAWPTLLKGRLPEAWLAGISSQKTILPYPLAEVGVNSSKRWNYVEEIQKLKIDGLDDDKKSKAGFLIALLAQHNFYTNAKQTMLLNIGRIFELLIASIVGPLSVEDIHAIMGRAPFFSAAALAPTKTITIDEADDKHTSSNDEDVKGIQEDEQNVSSLIKELHREVETWRMEYQVDQIELSPWLVYKVFNKVFSQVASSEKVPNGMKNIGRALNMAAHTFYVTWFSFGSFEKGELFGLPNVVATTNVNLENLKNYERHDQFKTNVLPFTPTLNQISNNDEEYQSKTDFGQISRVVSYVLAGHPLKKWIDEVIKFDWPNSKADLEIKAEKYLREKLGINAKNINKSTIKTQARRKKQELSSIYNEMTVKFSIHNKYTKTLGEVINELNDESETKATPHEDTQQSNHEQIPAEQPNKQSDDLINWDHE